MNDFTIGSREFKCLKIDAFEQFHIVRRIGPILADLLPSLKKAANFGKTDNSEMTQEQQLEQIGTFAAPILTGLSKLSDADSEYVLYGLLKAVEVKQSAGNWARVAQGTPPMLMMQDLDFPVLMQIAARAFGHNMSSFFSALPHQ